MITARAAAGLTSATGRVAWTTSASGWVKAAVGVGEVDGVGAATDGLTELGAAGTLGVGAGSAGAGVQAARATSTVTGYAPRAQDLAYRHAASLPGGRNQSRSRSAESR